MFGEIMSDREIIYKFFVQDWLKILLLILTSLKIDGNSKMSNF